MKRSPKNLVESRMLGNGHVRFGRRHGETDQQKCWHRAPCRPYEFAGRTGHRLYFDADEATVIRAEGERLVKLIEAAEFPFGDTHTGFQADPSWPVPRFPDHVVASLPELRRPEPL